MMAVLQPCSWSLFFAFLLISLRYVTKAVPLDQIDKQTAEFAMANFEKGGKGGVHIIPVSHWSQLCKVRGLLHCVATCGFDNGCAAVVYRERTQDCIVYNEQLDSSAETIPDIEVTYLEKLPVGQWDSMSIESGSKSRRQRRMIESGSGSMYRGEAGSSSIQSSSMEDDSG